MGGEEVRGAVAWALALAIVALLASSSSPVAVGHTAFYASYYNPGAPSNLTAMPSRHYVDLHWDAPLDVHEHPVASYLVYRNEVDHPDRSTLLDALNATTFGYRDALVTWGETYTYYVVARTTDGRISGHSIYAVATVGVTTASAPNDLSAVPMDGSVELSWSPPDNHGGVPFSSYNVYRRSGAGNLTLVCSCLGDSFNHPEVTDTALTNGARYEYEVRAVNAFGEGPGATVNVTPNFAPRGVEFSPPLFQGGSGDLYLPLSFNISWAAPSNSSGVTHYKLYFHKPGPDPARNVAIGLNTTFVLNGAAGDLRGTFVRVSAVYSDGSESFSEEALVPAHLLLPFCGGAVVSPEDLAVMFLMTLPAVAVVVAFLVAWRRNA